MIAILSPLVCRNLHAKYPPEDSSKQGIKLSHSKINLEEYNASTITAAPMDKFKSTKLNNYLYQPKPFPKETVTTRLEQPKGPKNLVSTKS